MNLLKNINLNKLIAIGLMLFTILAVSSCGSTTDIVDGDTDGDEETIVDGDKESTSDGDTDDAVDGDIDGDTEENIDGDTDGDIDVDATESSPIYTMTGDKQTNGEELGEELKAFLSEISLAKNNSKLEPFVTLPGEAQMQVHPAAAFDNSGIWIVYNNFANEDNGNGAIYLTKIASDGSYLVDPIKVSTLDDTNNIDPALTIGDDTITVVWAGDNSSAQPNNLAIYYRQFDKNGTSKSDNEIKYIPIVDNAEVQANVWIVQVCSLQNNAFAIAGSWADPDINAWRVFVQRFDAEGKTSGNLIPAYKESAYSQTTASIRANSDDTIFVSWVEQPPEEGTPDYVVFTSIAADSETPNPATPIDPTDGTMSGTPIVNIVPDAQETVFVSYYAETSSTNTNIIIQDATNLDNEGNIGTFGKSGKYEYSQNVAPTSTGGAVMWARQTSGFYGDIFFNSFDRDENGIVPASTEMQLNTANAVAYYTPSLIAITANLYFAMWVEPSKNMVNETVYTLKSRFIDRRQER